MATKKASGAGITPRQPIVSQGETTRAVEPWNMSRAEWYRFALTGELHPNEGKPAPYKIGSQDTPLSLGESEGYPLADVAHFYLARRSRRIGRNRELLTDPEMIDYARREYVQDAIREGKSVHLKILAELGLRPRHFR